jgi:oligopeptide transport system substrate-binding protein
MQNSVRSKMRPGWAGWILRSLGTAVPLAGIALAGGCTKPTSLIAPKNHLRFPLMADPMTLDSALAVDDTSLEVVRLLQHGLTKRDTYGKVLPALAERWDISHDGKTITFHLRAAKWSDGVEVKAPDFVFAWQRLLDPKNTNPAAARLFAIDNAEAYHTGKITDFAAVGIKAPDAERLELTLARPDPTLLEALSLVATVPGRQDIFQSQPNDFAQPLNLRTTGPYIARDWEKGVRLDLVANPYYYGRKPEITRLELDEFKDPAAALAKYEKNDLDILMPIPASERERLKQSPDYRAIALLKSGPPPAPLVSATAPAPQYEKIGILVKPYLEDFTVDILGQPCVPGAHFRQENPAEP